jgi:hypothetical protein
MLLQNVPNGLLLSYRAAGWAGAVGSRRVQGGLLRQLGIWFGLVYLCHTGE